MHDFYWVERSEIDEQKWTDLVINSSASMYNQLAYLDQLSEHWCALVYNDYEGAIAVPYTIRMGVKGAFTPNFIRALEWMGINTIQSDDLLNRLQEKFCRGNFHIDNIRFSNSSERVYQNIFSKEDFVIGSQTKRAIKKFEKLNASVSEVEVNESVQLTISELKNKVKDLKAIDFVRFEKFLSNYPGDIKFIGVKIENKIHAASILIEWNSQVHFIKGGVDEFGKKNGMMHALMFHTIDETLQQNKIFSFEGSSVDSVRQFNRGFGGEDVFYDQLIWDNSPFWFKTLQKLKSLF